MSRTEVHALLIHHVGTTKAVHAAKAIGNIKRLKRNKKASIKKMKIIPLNQGSDEWLTFRKQKLGASDAPIILNESPWTSPMQLWERKLGIALEQIESKAMSRGHALEHEARCAFMIMKNMTVTPEVIQHGTHDWMIASLDGLSVCKKYAVEIKCPGRDDHLSALQGVIPKKYYPQLQHQIAVTGLDMIYYFSYDGNQNALIEIKRDQEYIDKMIEEELKFYKCMTTCTPPELSERDYNIRNDDKWFQNSLDWQDAQRDLRLAQEREEDCRKRLIALSQSRNSKGFGVKVQRIMRRGSVEYSEIPALVGINLDDYRKPASESWRITLDQ